MKTLLVAAVLGALVAGVLSGCSTAVALDPAADATNALCASVVVALRDTPVADETQRDTDAQGTAAWGSPATVLLRCGVAIPAPTAALPCVLVGDVYWLRDDTDAPNYVFTTYGRTPATEVIVNQTKVSPGVALYAVESAVALTKKTGACTEITDSLGTTATPTPTPAP